RRSSDLGEWVGGVSGVAVGCRRWRVTGLGFVGMDGEAVRVSREFGVGGWREGVDGAVAPVDAEAPDPDFDVERVERDGDGVGPGCGDRDRQVGLHAGETTTNRRVEIGGGRIVDVFGYGFADGVFGRVVDGWFGGTAGDAPGVEGEEFVDVDPEDGRAVVEGGEDHPTGLGRGPEPAFSVAVGADCRIQISRR